MKTKFLTPVIVAVAIASVTACKKNNDRPVFEKADDFWASHQIENQQFTGNATTGFSITGAKGIKVDFPANAFVDGDGNVISGNVTVSLKEVLSKKDVLLSGVWTEAHGQLLESGGEMLVKARQGDKQLQINPDLGLDSGIVVEVPKVMNRQDMGLFIEQKRDQQGGQTGGGEPADPTTWVPAPYYPFGNGPNSYSFTLPGFTWVNCDKFYNDPNPKTTITVLPDFQDDTLVTDLQVILVFKNIATVITLPYNSFLGKFESYANSLPVGLEAHLVLIGKDSGGYIQFGVQSITISANMHIDAPIKRSTQAEVDAFLSSIQ